MASYPRKFLLETLDSDKKYEACYMCYVCPDDCTKYLSPPPPFAPSQKHQMSPILIVMLCVLGAAFLLLSYLTICRYRSTTRNSRRRNSPQFENNNFTEDLMDENQGPFVNNHIWFIRTVGLSQSIIDTIEVFKYKMGEGLIEGSDCSICLSEFEEDESLRLLPKCSHAFHVPCIDTWLRSHKNCPVCRAPIVISNTNPTQVNASGSDTISSNSESRDEPQMESESELERNENVETRDVIENTNGLIPIENEKMSGILSRNEKIRVLSDLADHRVKFDQELLPPVRRSVSMDFSSASLIYPAMANIYAKKDEGCSDSKASIVEKRNSDMIANRGIRNLGIYRLIKSSSHGRSIQKGSVMMKRSLSFNRKRSLRKHSRSQESISTPEIVIL